MDGGVGAGVGVTEGGGIGVLGIGKVVGRMVEEEL